jgi:FtsK/SpoIIIE family
MSVPRRNLLAQEGLVSLHDRFQEGRTDVPFLILVFDEFADLILTGRNEKREFEEMVARLAGKGRAAGIHLVLATQRPDRTVVTGLIKSNLPMKVCLRVANATNSQIVLGEPGAESLLAICFATSGEVLCELKATSSHRWILSERLEGRTGKGHLHKFSQTTEPRKRSGRPSISGPLSGKALLVDCLPSNGGDMPPDLPNGTLTESRDLSRRGRSTAATAGRCLRN